MGDYIKVFNTLSEQQEYRSGTTYVEPHVSCLADGTSLKYNSDWELTFVDLGLPSGTLWATCNLGTHSPSGYGNFYKWGEVQPYDGTQDYIYGESTSASGMTKYNASDGKTQLELSDDAAYNIFGTLPQGDVVIPTTAEWTELMNTCSWQKTSNPKLWKGTNNGKEIYLSFAGTVSSTAHTTGQYWTSTLNQDKSRGDCFYFHDYSYWNNNASIAWLYRRNACVIRPVIAPFRGYTKIYDQTKNFIQSEYVNPATSNWLYPYIGKDAIVVIDGVLHTSAVTAYLPNDTYGDQGAKVYGLDSYFHEHQTEKYLVLRWANTGQHSVQIWIKD